MPDRVLEDEPQRADPKNIQQPPKHLQGRERERGREGGGEGGMDGWEGGKCVARLR